MLDLIPGYAQAKAALRFIPYVGMGVLALVAALQYQSARHWSKVALNEKAAHAASVERYKGAQRVAAELNKAKVERIERERRDVANVKDTEIRRGIDAAVADAQRVWRQRAAKNFTRHADTSQIAGTTGYFDRSGGVPEFFTEDDVRICATNTLKAKGWQDFYSEISRAENTSPLHRD